MASWKDSVRALIASNVSLTTCPVSQDGITLVAANRVLLTGQTTAKDNGIYAVGTVAGGNAPLTRATDANTSALMGPETAARVSEGSVYAHTEWALTTPGPIALGTTALTFAKILAGTAIPAPALVATSNIALTGVVTVDGVASNTIVGDVLCTAQTVSSQNGYWTPNAGGAWTRPVYYASDSSVAALLGQLSGAATSGTLGAGSVWYQSAGTTLAGAKPWTKLSSANRAPIRAVQTRQLSTDGTILGSYWIWNSGTNTWTAPVNGALPSPWTLFDSITTPVVGDRVEVNGDPAASNSIATPKAGIFTITSLGSGGTPAVLTRAADLDTAAEFVGGVAYDVLDGIKYKATRRALKTQGTIVLNTTPLEFGSIVAPSRHFVDLSAAPYNIRDWPNATEWNYNDGTDHYRALDQALWDYKNDKTAILVLPTANGGHICGVKPFRHWGSCTLAALAGRAVIDYQKAGGFACVVQQLSPLGYAHDGNPAIGPTVDTYANATSLSSWHNTDGYTWSGDADSWFYWNLSHAGLLLDGWSEFECRMLIRFESLGSAPVIPIGHIVSCRGSRVGTDVDYTPSFTGVPFAIYVSEGTPSLTATMRLTDTTAGVYGATVHTGGGAGTVVGHASVKPTEDCPNFTVKIHTGGTAGVAGVKIQISPDGVNYRAPVALGTATDYTIYNEVNNLGLAFSAKVTFSGALVAGDTYRIPCSGVNQNVSLTSSTTPVINTNYDICLQYRGGKVYFYVSVAGGAIDSGASAVTGVSATGVVKQRYWETSVLGRAVNNSFSDSGGDFNASRFYLGGIRFKSSSVTAPTAITSLYNNNAAVGAGVTDQKLCFVPSTDTVQLDVGGLRSCYVASTEPGRDQSFLHPRSTRTGGQFTGGGFKNIKWLLGADASQRASALLTQAWTTWTQDNCEFKDGNWGWVSVGPNFGSLVRDMTWGARWGFSLDFFQGQLDLSGTQVFQNGSGPCYMRAGTASVSAPGLLFANGDSFNRCIALLSDVLGGGFDNFSCDVENQIMLQCGSELIRISVASGYTWSLGGNVFTAETFAVVTQTGTVGEVAIGKLSVTAVPMVDGSLIARAAVVPFVSELSTTPPFLVSDQYTCITDPLWPVTDCSRAGKWNKAGVASVNVLADSNATVAWVKGVSLKIAANTWTANRTKTIGVTGARLGDIQEILLEPQATYTTTIANGGAAGGNVMAAIPAATFVRLRLRLDETFNWVSV